MLRRALIVDDQSSFCTWATALLEAHGFTVVGGASTGTEALEMARRLHPDVILLDIQLPDFDGFEVARRLALERDPPAVVLTSAREAADYGSRVRKTRARGFISKADLTGRAFAELIGES